MKKAISRRDFLKVVGVSAAALGMTACGGSSASTSTSTAASTAASSTASSAAAGAGEGGSGNDYKLTWNEVNGEDNGEDIVKYGVVIGRATADIPAGSWVHLHVMRSVYDQRSSHLDVRTGAPKDTKYE